MLDGPPNLLGRVLVWEADSGDWWWHLVRKGRVIAESGEGYRRRGAAERAATGIFCGLYPVTTVEPV